MRKKTFYQQVLKLGANEASAQGLQNALYNECHTKFLTKLWHLKIASLYGGCMKPGCIGKTNTNNLPAPTDLTENPYAKKNFFLTMQLKNRLACQLAGLYR
jgi:hypothetical protein